MTCEYECYCNKCQQMVSWTSDEYDGNSCPNCGLKWVRPLPKPSKCLHEALGAHTRANERDAHRINIIFAVLGALVLVWFIIVAASMY